MYDRAGIFNKFKATNVGTTCTSSSRARVMMPVVSFVFLADGPLHLMLRGKFGTLLVSACQTECFWQLQWQLHHRSQYKLWTVGQKALIQSYLLWNTVIHSLFDCFGCGTSVVSLRVFLLWSLFILPILTPGDVSNLLTRFEYRTLTHLGQ